ncbi:MAG: hypothetical protein K1X71_11625 [Pirellulales bacterium]|nr:hypothetical protein [Pirellulales bacterium]
MSVVGVLPVADVQITPVRTAGEMRQFIDLPWRLYEGEPNWAPPLKSEVRHLLDRERHPFWQFSERELFLAMRGNQAVGRIVAHVDRNYNEFHNERMGAWGFFESIDDQRVASSLFGAAEQWARDRGMDFLRGPLNPSTNYEIGMLIDGYQYPPCVMMPYNPRYYVDLAENHGLVKEKDLISLLLEPQNAPAERVGRLAARIRRNNNISIRAAKKKDFHSELALIKEIYHATWSKSWGFVPMTDAEMDQMGETLLRIIDPDLVLFVYFHGEPVGICVIIPDINPLLKRFNGKVGVLGLLTYWRYRHEVCGLRAILFGFKQEAQKVGLPLVVFDHLNHLLREKKHYKYLELGWNLEDNENINRFDAEIGGRPYKRYRIFRKDL